MKTPTSILLVLFFLFLSAAAFAQPAIRWQKTYGGFDIDEGRVITQTSDGGFIFLGSTASTNGDVTGNHGGFDIWVIKLDPSGAIEWKKTLGGSLSENGHNIRQTADGGYILACHTRSSDGDITGNHGGNDAWIVKLSPAGAIVWQKALGSPGYDRAYSIEQTFDGGYIFAGVSDDVGGDVTVNHGAEDYWVVKLSSTGSIEWEKSFGGSDEDVATAIIQTADSGYIVLGNTASSDGDVTFNHGDNDVWVIKLSKSGSIEWQKTYGGSAVDASGSDISPGSIRQTSDGYIFSGWTASTDGDVTFNHGGYDFWVVKLSPTGSLVWQKTYGGSADDEANSIRQTSDGGYILAGVAQSTDGDVIGNHGGYDFWLVKITSAGAIQWQKAMGGPALGVGDCAFSAEQTSDLGYIVGGYSEGVGGDITAGHGAYDFWAVKLLCAHENVGRAELCKGDSITLTNVWLAGTWSSASANVAVTSASATCKVVGLSAGTAVITYEVWNACGWSKPMSYVTVNALPTPVITSAGQTMTTTVPYATYQWFSASGAIAGATDSTYTASSYGGTYRVYVTDSNGCSDTSHVFTLVPDGVTNNILQSIGVYPNPASTTIYVNGAGHCNIKLFDAMGRLIKESDSAGYVDVSAMVPGCYLLQIWNDTGELIHRETVVRR